MDLRFVHCYYSAQMLKEDLFIIVTVVMLSRRVEMSAISKYLYKTENGSIVRLDLIKIWCIRTNDNGIILVGDEQVIKTFKCSQRELVAKWSKPNPEIHWFPNGNKDIVAKVEEEVNKVKEEAEDWLEHNI